MKLSVCIDAVYNGRNFIESMESIKKLGIGAIEFWCWWDKDLAAIKKTAEKLRLEIASFCTRFVSLVDASVRDKYLEGLAKSVKVAKKLGANRLITQVGNELTLLSREKQHRNLVAGLKVCTPLLEKKGITLLVEPLNTLVDHKGYYLYSSEEAFSVIEEVGSDRVKVLYDIYHQQIMEGNLISTISRNIDKIGHFHAAGNPGRHELSCGEINYDNIFRALDDLGYGGYVGLEYFPENEPEEGLRELMSRLHY